MTAKHSVCIVLILILAAGIASSADKLPAVKKAAPFNLEKRELWTTNNIHGTPDPSKISKSESHGCIRLTNWDALQLASAVAKGVVVEFTGDETARRAARADARPAKSRHRRR